ncbi:MAG: ATP synthase F1 subunit gamma [Phycisphaerae bacterium]|nr:ATP synthase F1 subunit gamma [Phycisphaerae bacterium]|tara:strand:+ start:1096 stop:1974 length:879 start_codon:yes stop_codon:yes gene_type:complete
MAQIREIKKRIGAVQTIARITKTMQMIATAKFTSALQRAESSKPYAACIDDMVRQAATAAGEYESKLISGPDQKVGKELVLVICSDRGLCGAYNGTVLRTALNYIRDLKSNGIDYDLEVAGKKGLGYFKFQRVDVDNRHDIGDKPSYEDVGAIAASYIERYMAGEYDAIRIISMRFVTTSRQVPEIKQLLPMAETSSGEDSESTGYQPQYDFLPSARELLDELLPLTVKTALLQAFNEAVVSEQIMRMIAMKAATENAKEFGSTLRRLFNRARQGQITTELTEIVSGAAALE